jgi:hypothetical protein
MLAFARRRAVPLLGLAAALLAAWTVALAYRLPARHTTHDWDVAWIGFDVGLVAALGATALALARRAPWARPAAVVAATLLVCDAWFDNVLATGLDERVEAAVEAAALELPLALVCLWLARSAAR